jgi:hypothetical protein
MRKLRNFEQGPEVANAVTPPIWLHNAGAGSDKSDAENLEENDSDAEADHDWGDQLYSSSAITETSARDSSVDHCLDLGHW